MARLHDKEDRADLRRKLEDAYELHWPRDKESLQRQLGVPPDAKVPHFVLRARPQEVPPELLSLPADARVTFDKRIGRDNANGICNAGDLRAQLEGGIARQARGAFTVNEAAQVLADAGLGSNAGQWVEDIRAAHNAGVLAIRDSASRIPMYPAQLAPNAAIPTAWTAKQGAVRDWQDLVMAEDLDGWLKTTAGHVFPSAAAMPAVAESPKMRRAGWLEMVEAEQRVGRGRGAIARLAKSVGWDASNMSKELQKARNEREAQRRAGALTGLAR